MSWSTSCTADRETLWQEINALTASQTAQPGETQEAIDFGVAEQLHHAKAGAKAICNSFDAGDYPALSVNIGGHFGASAFVSVSVYGLNPQPAAEEPQPAAVPALEPAPETPTEPIATE